MPIVNNTALCTYIFVKRVELMLSVLTTIIKIKELVEFRFKIERLKRETTCVERMHSEGNLE